MPPKKTKARRSIVAENVEPIPSNKASESNNQASSSRVVKADLSSSRGFGDIAQTKTLLPHQISKPEVQPNISIRAVKLQPFKPRISKSEPALPNIKYPKVSLSALGTTTSPQYLTKKTTPIKESVDVQTQTRKTLLSSLYQEDSTSHPSSQTTDLYTSISSNKRDHLQSAVEPRRSLRPNRSKSQCSLECCEEEDMETRSKARLMTPHEGRRTPRTRTSARTRPLGIKKEPEDDVDHVKAMLQYDDVVDSTGRRDVPKHLFGLDGNNEPALSSTDDEICVDGDTNNNVTIAARPKAWCSCSPWCVLTCMAVLVAMVAISSVFQPCPHDAVLFKGLNIRITEDDAEDKMDSNLRELQEKLEQLSAQVSGLRQTVIKNETEEAVDTQQPMTKETLKLMLEKMLRDNMEAALDKYSADKLGIPDYALESDGGAIHFPHHSTTFNTGTERGWFGLSFWYDTVSPRVIIQPDNKPGQCWAFQGQQGYVVIKLSRAIIPTMFTLEHIPSSLSTNGHGKIPTAPKDFSVWGWADPEGTEKVMLGNFTYKKEGKSLQTFQVKGTPSDAVFRYVELRVLSNHGQATHTCIYRLRVHGDLPPTTRP